MQNDDLEKQMHILRVFTICRVKNTKVLVDIALKKRFEPRERIVDIME